jgi:hypothetical protein
MWQHPGDIIEMEVKTSDVCGHLSRKLDVSGRCS